MAWSYFCQIRIQFGYKFLALKYAQTLAIVSEATHRNLSWTAVQWARWRLQSKLKQGCSNRSQTYYNSPLQFRLTKRFEDWKKPTMLLERDSLNDYQNFPFIWPIFSDKQIQSNGEKSTAILCVSNCLESNNESFSLSIPCERPMQSAIKFTPRC